MHRFTLCCLLGSLAVPVLADESISFSRQIRGILSDRCFQCHGPDEAQRQAGLRLDQHDAALAELHSGDHAIVPGNVDESALYQRLISDDEDLRMPPADSGKTVSAAEQQLLRQWIEQGAEWGKHWAFEPIVRPELPQRDAGNHPVDVFVDRRLQQANLAVAEAADRATLLRRVSLDLTGLLPTVQEVDAFVADESSDAYEHAVVRLLDSSRYGEHMSRYWLDVARYGDTHGLHLDNFREMWAYRDWVVNAFNANKPYDVFITEQLAGDLLPNATQEQLIASGFNRCNVTTSEGGSIAEEVHVRNVVDRVVTTGTAFMALTMDCTRCHDHKFDPLTMKDFYSFYAFFNSFDGNPLDGNKKDHAPVLKVFTQAQQSELTKLEAQRSAAEQRMDEILVKANYQESEQPIDRALKEPEDFVWIEDGLPAGVKASSKAWQFKGEPQPVYGGKKSNELVAKGLEQNVFENAPVPLVVAEGDSLFCHIWLDPENPPREIMLQFFSGSWGHRVYWGDNLIDWGQDNTASRFHAGALPKTGEWVRLEVNATDVGLAAGAAINGWACTQHGGRALWDHAGICGRTNRSPWYDSFASWHSDMAAWGGAQLPADVKAIVVKAVDERTESETTVLKQYFLRNAWSAMREPLAPLRTELSEVTMKITGIRNSAGTTLVYKEKAEPKSAYMLTRGEYDQKGESVERGVPEALPEFPEDAPANRIGVSRWLTSPRHPLTSRVAVNRIWQQFFGIGIVRHRKISALRANLPVIRSYWTG